jgi:protein required for attachment to host cells
MTYERPRPAPQGLRGTIVVVANASRARIVHVHGGALAPLAVLAHPESRRRERDLVSDRPGRTWTGPAAMGRMRGAVGSGAMPRTALAPTSRAHENTLQAFAREVSAALELALRGAPAVEVALVAPPHVLGVLRAALDVHTAARVTVSVPHDYTWRTNDALLDALERIGIRGVRTPEPA